MGKEILSVHEISKQYPGVLALDNVSIDFIEGETHALVGENGAGKSTLIKILSGAIRQNSGLIKIFGKDYSKITPSETQELGISVIYQEFNLMNSLTVAENVFMGYLPSKKGIVNWAKMVQKTNEIFEMMKVKIDPKAVVMDLSVAYMQLVEIAKSLSRNLKILIMDEPTAPLTASEVNVLFGIISTLKEQGVTIIFISHRLEEIFKICDRVTILRDGKKVLTKKVSEIDKPQLVKGMVGREISNAYPKRNFPIGETVLKVENLSGNGVRGVDFELHRGEVLGFAGLVGAGRTEIMRVLFGADPKDSGEAIMSGNKMKIKSPRHSVKNGIVLLPEDRKHQGVLLHLPISQNITLPSLKKVSNRWILSKKKEKNVVNQHIDSLKIACHSSKQIVSTLSGGNQQKVVLAKWLTVDADVLIFDEPTRGIDVGAKYEIYQLMNEICSNGKSIIMISSEMDEMIGMSDRIIVMYEGKQMSTLEKEDFSQETIIKLGSGEI